MHQMFYIGTDGKRVYTLKKTAPDGTATQSAHPGESTDALPQPKPRRPLARLAGAERGSAAACRLAASVTHAPLPRRPASTRAARFSPDDKFSKQRLTIKKRYGQLPTQKPIEDI